jgi:phospholipid/cholesterol/gamma-HCH transport system substrate-binding protein
VALRKEAKTGIIITVALGMLIYGLNFLKGINVFSHSKKIYAVYTDVQGIVPSNPVVINGFHVGQVRNISIMPDASGRIVMTLLISNPDVKIPKRSIAKIISADFLGSKEVQIILSKDTTYITHGSTKQMILRDDTNYLSDGDTLKADVETSLKETVNQQVLPVKKKVEELIASMDSTLVVVQAVFNQETVLSIRGSLKHFANTASNLDDLMATEKTRLTAILDNVGKISSDFAKNSKQISAALANVTDSLSKANLKATINNADSALYYTSKILKKINSGQGSLGLLANDTALYHRLTYASDQMGKLIEDLKAHPKRYVHFSIFGKKDK